MLKYFLALFLLSTCAIALSPGALLGAKECSLGPSFWCKNITNAKNCNAVKHCIQTVWELKAPALDDDDDDVCSLCKAMVNNAREQLESNETMDMIKDVFERSCKLMVLKPVVKLCIKFSDEYAEELVDMLDSYMSPDMICTLAGLCSSGEIDRMNEDAHKKKLRDEERNAELQKDCEPCMDLARYIGREIEIATPDEVKQYFKDKCNYFGSFSLSCTNIIDDVIPVVYKKIATEYTPESFCYLTSACINGFGRSVQVKTESDSGVIHFYDDDIPVVKHLTNDQTCVLCKSMVNRFRDILVSNTTEIEFKEMMRAMCKQTGKFLPECIYLIDEYYDKVYNFLVKDFNAEDTCIFFDLCDLPEYNYHGPGVPVLPHAPTPVEEVKIKSIRFGNPDLGVQVITPVPPKPVKVEISYGDPLESKYQLPLERMAIPQKHDLLVNSRETCMFCQYLLHYIQKVISQPYGENALKQAVDKVCDQLPQSLTLQCRNFVQEFGDAFVAILAQEIDPSQVCPAVRACPSRILDDRFFPIDIGGAPMCPLCLMAVEDITEKLKDNKTEDAIRKALHNLCDKMAKNLRPQCNQFVQKYTEEVVDMIVADFTPQEVCTYLKICHTKVDVELVAQQEKPHEKPGEKQQEKSQEKPQEKQQEKPQEKEQEKHEILTNEIPRGDVEEDVDAMEKNSNQPTCFLCEFVMDKVKDQLKDNETEEEVKRIVLGACKSIPKAIESDCHDFVNNYSKFIVEMLENNVDPGMVCREMHMCREQDEKAHLDVVALAVEDCAICEALVGAIRGLLEDKNFDRNMSRYAGKICYSIPFLRPYQMDKCKTMVLSYGPSIINLLIELGVRPELVCTRLELCDETEQAKVHLIESSTDLPESHPQERPHLLGGNSCTWGPSYWCQSEDHAKECGTLAHCREVVWKADKPTTAA